MSSIVTETTLMPANAASPASENSHFNLLTEITEALRLKLAHASKEIVAAGELLLQAKTLLGHGNFLIWLGQNFGMSAKTANRFMSVAKMVRKLNLDAETVSQLVWLDLRTLYELAARSTPPAVQQELIKQFVQQGHLSYLQVRNLKQANSQNPVQPDFRSFTHQLGRFESWFEKWSPVLVSAPPSLDPALRQELEAHTRTLKAAVAKVEELLSHTETIQVQVLPDGGSALTPEKPF